MDLAITLLTLVLVLITGYYARQTRLTVEEMRAARRAALESRRRDKSEAAAQRALDAARQIQYLVRQSGASRVDPAALAELSKVLDAEASLIDDDHVSKVVDTCSVLAFTASWSEEAIAREQVKSAGVVRLRLQGPLNALRRVLEDYVREREYNESNWDDLPERSGAQAWLLRSDRPVES